MAKRSGSYVAQAYTPAPDYMSSYKLMEQIDSALGGNTGLTSGYEQFNPQAVNRFDFTEGMPLSDAYDYQERMLARQQQNKIDFEQSLTDFEKKQPKYGGSQYTKDYQGFDTLNKEISSKIDERGAGQTVVDALKAIGGSFAQGVVNLAGTTAGAVERQATASGVDPNAGVFTNIQQQFAKANDFESGARAVGKTMQMLINVLKPEMVGTGGEGGIKGFARSGGSDIEPALKPVEQKLTEFANVENQGLLTQVLAGSAGSMPSSAVTKIPVLGWFLMGNQSFRNSLDSTRAQMEATGQPIDENTMYIKALGDAGIEVGTEMLFPLFKKAGATTAGRSVADATKGLFETVQNALIKTGKDVGKETIESFGKFIAKQSAEEGAEEIIGGILSGFLAKATTNKDDALFGVNEQNGLITLVGLFKAAASGALMGGAMSAINNPKSFVNTKKALEQIDNATPIEELSTEDAENVVNAAVVDMKIPANQEVVAENLVDVLSGVAQEEYTAQQQAQVEEAPTMTAEPSRVTVEPSAVETQQTTPMQGQAVVEPSTDVAQELVAPSQVLNEKPHYQKVNGVEKLGRDVRLDSMPDNVFFAHQTPAVNPKYKVWDIVDKQTGVRFSTSSKTLKEAITKANNNILENGLRESQNRIDKALKYINAKQPTPQTVTNVTETKSVKQIQPKKPVKSRKAIEAKIKNGDTESVEKDVEEWLDTDEAKAEFKDIKTEEDITAKIDEARSNISQGIDFGKNFLQALAYKKLLERLKNMPKDSAINRYLVQMIDFVTKNDPDKVKREFENKFPASEFYHKIYTDVEGIANANKQMAQDSKSEGGIQAVAWEMLQDIVRTDRMPTKDENIYLGMYVQSLYESGNTELAQRFMEKIMKVATKGGQFIQSFAAIYKSSPDWQAGKLIKELELALTPPRDTKLKVDAKTKDLVEGVKKIRRKAVDSVAKEVDKEVKDVPEKQPKTLAELVAKRVEDFVTSDRKKPKEQTAESKIVSRLFQKAKEAIDKNTRLSEEQKDVRRKLIDAKNLTVFADILVNRNQYKGIWEDAKDFVSNEDLNETERDNINRFLDEFADPITAKKYMNQVMLANIRDMGMTLSEFSQRYFLAEENEDYTQNAVFANFFNTLKKKMPNMDSATYEYMKESLAKNMKNYMEGTRSIDVTRIMNLVKQKASPKDNKTQEQIIVDLLSRAVYARAFDTEEIRALWLSKMGVAELTESMKNDITNTMKAIAKTSNEDEKGALYDSMAARMAAQVPSTFTEKIQGIMRTSMLLKMTTFAGNATSNILLAPSYFTLDRVENMLDKALKVDTKDRIAGDKVISYKADSDSARATMRVATDAHIKREMAKTNKYTFGSILNKMKRIYKNNFMNNINNFVFDVMSDGDFKIFKNKFFGDFGVYSMHYRNAMANYLNKNNYSESMDQDTKDTLIANAMIAAEPVATERTFRNMTSISNLLKGLEDSASRREEIYALEKAGKYEQANELRNKAKIIKFLLKVVNPFVVTPAAIVSTAYKFSPLALVETVAFDWGVAKINKKWQTSEKRAKFAHKFAQASVGTFSSVAIGMVLGAMGVLDGAPPDDENEKQAWIMQGRKEYSIHTPLGTFPIDWAAPFSLGIMIGAQAWQNIDKAETFGQAFVALPKANLEVLIENSLVQNIKRAFGSGFQPKSWSDIGLGLLSSALFQGMPGLLAQLNRAIDSTQRDVYSGTATEILVQRLLSYVPYLSSKNPPKIDIWGDEIKQYKGNPAWTGAQQFIYNMVLPFRKTENQMDDLSKEVIRVYEATKTTNAGDALPSPAEMKFEVTRNGKTTKYELSSSDFVDYQKAVGQKYKQFAERLIKSPEYKALSDVNKARALKNNYAKAREMAKAQYIKEYDKRNK